MAIRFVIGEPPLDCARSDCRIVDRGRQTTMAHVLDVYDKAGNQIPTPGPKWETHRECITCGASWLVKHNGDEPDTVVLVTRGAMGATP